MVVGIKTSGGACQDLGKRPRGDIKILSKCTRLPWGGGGGGGGHETRCMGTRLSHAFAQVLRNFRLTGKLISSGSAHVCQIIVNGVVIGLAASSAK